MTRLVAVVVLLALVVTGAGVAAWQLVEDDDIRSGTIDPSDRPHPTPTPSDTPRAAPEAPDPALQQFYAQPLSWDRCGEHECASIEVPLDYDEPDGRTIRLALLKNAADRPADRVGSLVVNPGGPGSPGTDYAAQASFAFGGPLRDRFDLIGFDPRGTGESAPVDCLTDRQLDTYIASDPDPDDPAEVAEFEDQLELIGEGCAERSGELAAHISTVEAARDMDVIRAVLGEEDLTYFGASYGTKLGATYADLFPERTGRLVLDGAVDVSLSSRELSVQQAEGFQVALNAYVDDCVDGGDCYLGGSRQEALASISAFLDEVERAPIPVGDRELAIGNAFYGIVAPLYNDQFWSFLDAALGSAMEGDAGALLELSDLYTARQDDGSYRDNSSEAIYAINCLDDPSFVPVEEIPEHFDDFEEASPTFGRVFAWGLSACSGLEVDAPEPRGPLTAEGAEPLLVIGTTRDPATPYRWAQSLAEQLEPAILVTRDGDGHTGYHQGNACVDEVVEDYLIEGVVPDGPVDCPA